MTTMTERRDRQMQYLCPTARGRNKRVYHLCDWNGVPLCAPETRVVAVLETIDQAREPRNVCLVCHNLADVHIRTVQRLEHRWEQGERLTDNEFWREVGVVGNVCDQVYLRTAVKDFWGRVLTAGPLERPAIQAWWEDITATPAWCWLHGTHDHDESDCPEVLGG